MMSSFTPLFSVIVTRYNDLITAAIFGLIWRYCQRERRCCFASHETMSKQLAVSVRTIERKLKILCDDKLIEDLDANLRNKAHRYIVTDYALALLNDSSDSVSDESKNGDSSDSVSLDSSDSVSLDSSDSVSDEDTIKDKKIDVVVADKREIIFKNLQIAESSSRSLMKLSHVTNDYLKKWSAYCDAQSKPPPAGWLVNEMKSAKLPPPIQKIQKNGVNHNAKRQRNHTAKRKSNSDAAAEFAQLSNS